MIVGVYGTLREGCELHRAIQGAEFLFKTSVGGFIMLDGGVYPFVIEDEDEDKKITVEFYKINVDLLNSLDFIEGHPSFYERRLYVIGGVKAWIYIASDKTKESILNYPVIESGDWVEHEKGAK